MTFSQAIAPAPKSDAVPAVLPPLQHRTPEQLREGLIVNVKGAGSADLAVARLIQDGARFMADKAGAPMGLATVEINYAAADRQGALGLATFQGNKGWFALSERSTKGIMEGVNRLRTTPFEQWTESQRQAFVQGNETILHESAHVTLPAYDNANVNAWRTAPRSFEEGLAEVATMTKIGDFMHEEFGVQLPEMSNRISQSTSAYTRYSERIARMLAMGTDGSTEQLKTAASQVGDNVRADQRLQAIAQRLVTNLGGPDAPPEITAEVEKTLEGFVDERNGTRTKLMQLQAALVDHKAGHAIDVPKILADMRAIDATSPASVAPSPKVGSEPIE